MADQDLTFLVVRGQRFVNRSGRTWRSWCKVCGEQYEAREPRTGVRFIPTACQAHRGVKVEARHVNARATSDVFVWEGQRAPAVHLADPWGALDQIPEKSP